MTDPAKLTPRLREAISALYLASPFDAALLATMRIVVDPSVSTACTDCVRTVWIGEKMANEPTTSQLMTVLAHEAYHKLLMHHERRGKRHARLFNVVTDHVINTDLRRRGFDFSGEIDAKRMFAFEDLLDACRRTGSLAKAMSELAAKGKRFSGPSNLPGDADAESLYAQLEPYLDDDFPDKGELSGTIDDVTEPDSSEGGGASAAQQVAADIASAALSAKAAGSVHSMASRVVAEITAPEPWQQRLARYVARRIDRQRDNRSFQRPSRRSPAGVILPSMMPTPKLAAVVAIDTSGSISDKEMATFFAHLKGVAAAKNVGVIHVVYADCAVQATERHVAPFATLQSRGIAGGGTDFRPVFRWVEENAVAPDILIYLTDLFGQAPDRAPGYPVIWACTSDQPAPWGSLVRIDVK